MNFSLSSRLSIPFHYSRLRLKHQKSLHLRTLSTLHEKNLQNCFQSSWLSRGVQPRKAYSVLPIDEKNAPSTTEQILKDNPKLTKDLCMRIYFSMVRTKALDKVLFDSQRQGRISFYMQSSGEEAATVASASGLSTEKDHVFAQYREQGVLIWRGFPLQSFVDQCTANVDDIGKGRQMPVHYGSKALKFQTISSPLATQIPQAAGAAYALKRSGKMSNDAVVACYFGDGASSEGDFHAGMNFAAVLKCPVLFICRNNQYAISTGLRDQFVGDGVVSKADGYGMASLRVDGNDALAIHLAVSHAREYAIKNSSPVLIELMTYRQGHHSTSDDSTRYRDIEEIDSWSAPKRHPISRLSRFLVEAGWWTDEEDKALYDREIKAVREALSKAEKKALPEIDETIFGDVLDKPSRQLLEQERDAQRLRHVYADEYAAMEEKRH